MGERGVTRNCGRSCSYPLNIWGFYWSGTSDLGPWTWDLGPGTWDPGPGTWDLGPGTCILYLPSVQNYKSLSLQSLIMEEKLQLQRWKCTYKFGETPARNCASSLHCFEFSKQADPRKLIIYFFPEPCLAWHV